MESITHRAKSGQYLTFRLDKQEYGVPIETVREINRVNKITVVPRTPDFVSGMMNLRGSVIPVIDLRVKFSLPQAAHTRETCTIVIDGSNGQIGMIVDAVAEVVTLSQEQIEPAPSAESRTSSYVTGIGKLEQKVLILIDVVDMVSAQGSLAA